MDDLLYDFDSIELFECIENMKMKLKKSNDEYREILTKIEKIKDKFPNIRGVLEDEEIHEMTLQETEKLLEVINLYREVFRIEEYEIFMLGGREIYKLLRKMGIV